MGVPKKTKPKSARTWVAIKVPVAAHALAQELLEIVHQRGWAGIESQRTGQHTLGAVLEESLHRLKTALAR